MDNLLTYINLSAKQALKLKGGLPHGMTGYQLLNEDIYKEDGLTITKDDIELSHLYVALSLYTRDLYFNIFHLTSENAEVLNNIVTNVNAIEKKKWGPSAFPYNDDHFPFRNEFDKLPKNLVQQAKEGILDLTIFNNPELLHEWTFKAGKRLFTEYFNKIWIFIKDATCSENGPYGLFKNKKPIANIIDTLSIIIITNAFAGDKLIAQSSLIVPLAVCIATIITKKSLTILCEVK